MATIEAILMVRDGAATLPRVLAHYAAQGVPVRAIDHGSNDATPDILHGALGQGVVSVRRVPFDGTFRLDEQMALKRELIADVQADWVLHLDADEVMEAPLPHQTLADLAAEADAAGAGVVDFDEFVFVPVSETEDHAKGDFVASMRRYYHFRPDGFALHRLFRPAFLTDVWGETGGHRATTDQALVHHRRGRKRHYLGLSLSDLRAQYLPRVFPANGLRRGLHGNRVPTSPDFVVPPDPARLFDLDADGWRTDRPEPRHLVFRQDPGYEAPLPAPAPPPDIPPMPFIVGTGRSGTTLLRMMLDSHPDVAVPPETHWLLPAARVARTEGWTDETLRAALQASHNWQDMGIDDDALGGVLADLAERTPAALLRAIYAAYARRHGKDRYGDKTPNHGLTMEEVQRALPEAAFVHVIRDGRDVAASFRSLWFGPGDDPSEAARFWAWRVGRLRQGGALVPRYLEVRYEALVTDTEATLRAVCDFCALPFHEAMLRSHERATDRLAELGDLDTAQGTRPQDDRRAIHTLTSAPPDRSRIGRFRQTMSEEDVTRFERVAGPLLGALGYPRAS